MPIEFPCTGCGQMLRVGDGAAGKQARCPRCSHVSEVPITAAVSDRSLLLPETVAGPGDSPFRNGAAAAPSPPHAAQSGPKYGPIPERKIQPVRIAVSDVWQCGYALWKEHLGLLVGATIVLIAINGGVEYAKTATTGIVGHVSHEARFAVSSLATLAGWVVHVYLGVGFTRLMLRLARRQPADIGTLFDGGARLLPAMGVSVLFGLLVFAGCLMLIIPGIIFALMWWPCVYLVIDGQAALMESFSLARKITDGNWGTAFVIWLLGAVVVLAGLAACCIGVLFTSSLAGMLWVVAYLMMSGQIAAEPPAKPYP